MKMNKNKSTHTRKWNHWTNSITKCLEREKKSLRKKREMTEGDYRKKGKDFRNKV
jgi:hypothetical protein